MKSTKAKWLKCFSRVAYLSSFLSLLVVSGNSRIWGVHTTLECQTCSTNKSGCRSSLYPCLQSTNHAKCHSRLWPFGSALILKPMDWIDCLHCYHCFLKSFGQMPSYFISALWLPPASTKGHLGQVRFCARGGQQKGIWEIWWLSLNVQYQWHQRHGHADKYGSVHRRSAKIDPKWSNTPKITVSVTFSCGGHMRQVLFGSIIYCRISIGIASGFRTRFAHIVQTCSLAHT